MSIFKKNEKKNANRLPIPDKVKKGYRYYCSLVAAVALMGCCTMTAFAAPAAGGDPLTVINNLSEFIFGLIRAVGLILLGYGILQVGMSFSGHDPSQRIQGLMCIAGAILIFFSPEILTALQT